MASAHYDYFIIGQGLAGSMLAIALIQRGKKVLVIDNDYHHSSSMVAAGTINPVTGPRLNISDSFNEYIEVAKPFYRSLEQQTKQPLYFDIPQFKLIKNQIQLTHWHQQKTKAVHDSLFDELLDRHGAYQKVEYGVAQIQQTAFIDTPTLLKSVKELLEQQNAYLLDKVDYANIKYQDGLVSYYALKAHRIAFCEGHQAIHNPWLQHLPFKLAKGEILTLSNTGKHSPKLLNWGNWCVPNGQGRLRLGSNFEWHKLDHIPSEDIKLKLITSMRERTTIKETVLEHQAGIRPSTAQRKPFVGKVSSLENAYCFNGFGSKGCLLIPFYVELLCEHLLDNKCLPTEITQHL